MTATTPLELAPVKARQQETWASGDYARLASLIVVVAERLVDAADLRAGSTVLDVATGSGNGAIAAAHLGAVATGIDYVPALLERGRERAAAERLEVDFRAGDVEALPFPDESFDAAISIFGSMFAPDQPRTAAELVRVTRRGGTIALASWTPASFIGTMFKMVASYVPPPPGLSSPLAWGTEGQLAALFGPDVTWTHRERTFTLRFPSADALVEAFATYYGPTLKAFEAAGAKRDALANDLRDLVAAWSRLEPSGPVAVPSAYLESVGVCTARA